MAQVGVHVVGGFEAKNCPLADGKGGIAKGGDMLYHSYRRIQTNFAMSRNQQDDLSRRALKDIAAKHGLTPEDMKDLDTVNRVGEIAQLHADGFKKVNPEATKPHEKAEFDKSREKEADKKFGDYVGLGSFPTNTPDRAMGKFFNRTKAIVAQLFANIPSEGLTKTFIYANRNNKKLELGNMRAILLPGQVGQEERVDARETDEAEREVPPAGPEPVEAETAEPEVTEEAPAAPVGTPANDKYFEEVRAARREAAEMMERIENEKKQAEFDVQHAKDVEEAEKIRKQQEEQVLGD